MAPEQDFPVVVSGRWFEELINRAMAHDHFCLEPTEWADVSSQRLADWVLRGPVNYGNGTQP